MEESFMRKATRFKKAAVVMGLTLAMALGSVITGSAAEGKVWKYTFNDGGSKEVAAPSAESGWIVGYTEYTKEAGYGLEGSYAGGGALCWAQPSTKEELNGALAGLDIDFTTDLGMGIGRFLFKDKNGTDLKFYVDLPAGTYKFTIYAGGASSNNVYNPNTIYLQGKAFDHTSVNGSYKDCSTVYSIDDIKFERTITLKKATKVEVKASNPVLSGDAAAVYGKDTAGGRAFMSAVVIEEVKADTSVPKTGVVSVTAICGVVALAGAGVAFVTGKKKED